MWVCVVITFSVIGFAWFKTTSKQFVALLNPDEVVESRAIAEKNIPPSPFATFFSTFKDLQANISELFNFSDKSNDFNIENGRSTNGVFQPVPVRKLPVTEYNPPRAKP